MKLEECLENFQDYIVKIILILLRQTDKLIDEKET